MQRTNVYQANYRTTSIFPSFLAPPLLSCTIPYGGTVQRLSFVCSTREVCCSYTLWNIQNLGAVSPPSSNKIAVIPTLALGNTNNFAQEAQTRPRIISYYIVLGRELIPQGAYRNSYSSTNTMGFWDGKYPVIRMIHDRG